MKASLFKKMNPLARREELKMGWRIFRSLLTDGKKYGSNKCLGVKAQRQWTPYSCTAAVAQMIAHYYGHRLSHMKAIKLTGCKPDGASLAHVAHALKREFGLKTRNLTGMMQIRAALKRGEPIITNDGLTYKNDHAILLVGQTAKGFWIADPVPCEVYWKHEDTLMSGADEFIAVAPSPEC